MLRLKSGDDFEAMQQNCTFATFFAKKEIPQKYQKRKFQFLSNHFKKNDKNDFFSSSSCHQKIQK